MQGRAVCLQNSVVCVIIGRDYTLRSHLHSSRRSGQAMCMVVVPSDGTQTGAERVVRLSAMSACDRRWFTFRAVIHIVVMAFRPSSRRCGTGDVHGCGAE